MPTITFASSKGGAGRTTSAIILATTLARRHSVVLIDADPDQRLMSWSAKAPLPDRLMVLKSEGEQHIKDEIDSAQKQADVTIIDLGARPTNLNAYAVGESDLVIIPMGDEHPDAECTLETLARLALEANAAGRDIPSRVLFNRTDERASKSSLAQVINTQVREKVDALPSELHERTAYSSLHRHGGTLHDMNPSEVAGLAQAIANAEVVAAEVIHALGWRGQRPAPTVQMSLRMKVDVYDVFRALCRVERRTNGEMLEVMLSEFLQNKQIDLQR